MIRRSILISTFIFILVFPSIGITASVGNIIETQGGPWKFSLGVEYDRIFDRDLNYKGGTIDVNDAGYIISVPFATYPGDSIDEMRLESNRFFFKGHIGSPSKYRPFCFIGDG